MPIKTLFQSMTGGEIAGWGLAVLAAFMTLIQVSPLKLNPWDRILAWLGQKLNGKQLADLQKQITAMWVNAHRAVHPQSLSGTQP